MIFAQYMSIHYLEIYFRCQYKIERENKWALIDDSFLEMLMASY